MLARTVMCAAVSMLLAGCASVRPVDQGAVYRAEGLSKTQLEQTIKDHQIRTIVNVRGFVPEAQWYKEQAEICKQQNIKQVDVQLAKGDPRREEVIELLETFKSAEKPILVVGNRGSSDVGFASGLYRIAILNQPKDKARGELPFWQSERLEGFGVGNKDRFLYEWRDEREFYEKYQVDESRRSARSNRSPAGSPERQVEPAVSPNAVQLGAPVVLGGARSPGL
ncbi:MAG: hypothetical protein U1D30_13170 [Planctomycetota bacterium]